MFLIFFSLFSTPPKQHQTAAAGGSRFARASSPWVGSSGRKERDPAVRYPIALSTASRRRLNPARRAASGARPGPRSVLSGGCCCRRDRGFRRAAGRARLRRDARRAPVGARPAPPSAAGGSGAPSPAAAPHLPPCQ